MRARRVMAPHAICGSSEPSNLEKTTRYCTIFTLSLFVFVYNNELHPFNCLRNRRLQMCADRQSNISKDLSRPESGLPKYSSQEGNREHRLPSVEFSTTSALLGVNTHGGAAVQRVLPRASGFSPERAVWISRRTTDS